MAIASFLKYTDSSLLIGAGNVVGDNKISSATPEDLAFYDRAAYRRMEQVHNGDQDHMIQTTYFPKASLELLIMFEMGWWPQYVEKTLGAFYYKQNATGTTVTAFDPTCLVKTNQSLIQLEIYKAVEIFYSTLVTDNSNINEKDMANHAFARKRFEEEWLKCVEESYFYDRLKTGVIGVYNQNFTADPNFFEGDRRYF
jgi:hypothetical protein